MSDSSNAPSRRSVPKSIGPHQLGSVLSTEGRSVPWWFMSWLAAGSWGDQCGVGGGWEIDDKVGVVKRR